MNWQPVAPPGAPEPVYVLATAGSTKGRHAPRWLFVFARASTIPGLEWWVGGAGVKVLKGSGEDLGVLRIEPGGPHHIRGRMGRGSVPVLGIPADLLGSMAGKHGPAPASFHVATSPPALLVSLPAWAFDPAKAVNRVPSYR